MSAPKLLRYFDLSGASDPDPIVTQPARDAFGTLLTGFGGEILVNAWEVDNDGNDVTPTGGLLLTMGIVTNSTLAPSTRPAGSTLQGKLTMDRWGRGPVVVGVEAGEWLIETQLSAVVSFTVAVTAHTVVADRWLAIYAARGPR